MLDSLAKLNQHRFDEWEIRKIQTRIAQYEMRFVCKKACLINKLERRVEETLTCMDPLFANQAHSPQAHVS